MWLLGAHLSLLGVDEEVKNMFITPENMDKKPIIQLLGDALCVSSKYLAKFRLVLFGRANAFPF